MNLFWSSNRFKSKKHALQEKFFSKQTSFFYQGQKRWTYTWYFKGGSKSEFILILKWLVFFFFRWQIQETSLLLFISNSRANQIEIIRYFIYIISEISHETILDLISSEIFNEITSLLLPVNHVRNEVPRFFSIFEISLIFLAFLK